MTRPDTYPVGEVVRSLRLGLDITQSELAYRAGVALATVQRVERGRMPSVTNLHRLAAALGVPVAELLGEAA